MRTRETLAHEVENRRKWAKNWGTDPEDYSTAELFRTFFGIAAFLSVAAVVLSWAIPAIRAIL